MGPEGRDLSSIRPSFPVGKHAGIAVKAVARLLESKFNKFAAVRTSAANWLKKLHEVPGRVYEQNLRSAGAGDDIIPESYSGGA